MYGERIDRSHRAISGELSTLLMQTWNLRNAGQMRAAGTFGAGSGRQPHEEPRVSGMYRLHAMECELRVLKGLLANAALWLSCHVEAC